MKARAKAMLLLGWAALLALAGSGCSGNGAEEGAWPKELVFAYYTDDELPDMRYDATAALARYLSERLGLPVRTLKSTQYGPIIEAFRADKLDISMLGTFSYVLAAEKAGVECIVSRRTDEGAIGYHSIIVARADRGIAGFEDLKRRSKEFTFAFANPASTSGHLIPRVFLEQENVFAERDFRELVFPGAHNATLLAILSGQIDAGCISENTFKKLDRLGRIDPQDLRVLWKSPVIPDGCIAVRGSLPDDLKKRIQEELVDLRAKDPKAWEETRKIYQFSSRPDGYYEASSDAKYDGIRKLASRLDQVTWRN